MSTMNKQSTGSADGPPRYDDAFPSMADYGQFGTSNGVNDPNNLATMAASQQSAEPAGSRSQSASAGDQRRLADPQQMAAPQLQRSIVTQVFHVPMEERKYKDLHGQTTFGSKGRDEQSKICQQIKEQTGIDEIELSLAKDQSLTVVLTGKHDRVLEAKRKVHQLLQAQIKHVMHIPKDHHRSILGQKGSRLQQLERNTGTKISLPRPDQDSDAVTITGSREGIERARHEIQTISDEQSNRAFERIVVPKIFHPFIAGPNNQRLQEWEKNRSVRVNVPPLVVQKDEITVSGERDGVYHVSKEISAIYEAKKVKCQTVSVEVRKNQHRYVIGPRGSGIQDVLAQTGCSVEVPPSDNPSLTITLRGEQDQLGHALNLLYKKANSVVMMEIPCENWLFRHVTGRRGENIKALTADVPRVHIELIEGRDKIEIEGPPEGVQKVYDQLRSIVSDLRMKLTFEKIKVDPKFHPHVIGKGGANINRIKNETGVTISIPDDGSGDADIRIEGSWEGVKRAKQDLQQLVRKLEQETQHEVNIEPRFHRQLIGQNGSKIREIREKFPDVQITFPDPGQASSRVQLRGPREQTAQCVRYLQQLHRELKENNYQAKVEVFKSFHKNLIGKGGAQIRKIREETQTQIELPSETSNSNVIVITGRRADVEKARKTIETFQQQMVSVAEVRVEIPQRLHQGIIGQKGSGVKALSAEFDGIQIRFPTADSDKADFVTIRGPRDLVDKAKKRLLQLATDKANSSYVDEVRANPSFHRFLIGRGGANINKLRELGVRFVFPSPTDADQELITIIGVQDQVGKAKKILLEQIEALANIVTEEIHVDKKYHRHFVGRNAQLIQQLEQDFGGVQVSFPRLAVDSDCVTLKGAKDCVEATKARISSIIEELENQVQLEVEIAHKFHGQLLGSGGHNMQKLEQQFGVRIKLPVRAGAASGGRRAESSPTGASSSADEQPVSPAAADGPTAEPDASDIIVISGLRDKCEAARDALLEQVPVTEEMFIPNEFHRFIIGQRGRDVRQTMDQCNVTISFPPAQAASDQVKITGKRENVGQAKIVLEKRYLELQKERDNRVARSFVLELHVDPKHHSRIIGKRGAVINELRNKFDVNIQLPDKQSTETDLIRIQGYEANAVKARDHIEKMVKTIESATQYRLNVDPRFHSRLIGSRGKAVNELMRKFKVDIRFPGRNDVESDVVVISGDAERVDAAVDHIKNLVLEYTSELEEDDYSSSYLRSSEQNNNYAPLQLFTDVEAGEQLASSSSAEVESPTTTGSSPVADNDGQQVASPLADGSAQNGRQSAGHGKGFVVSEAPWHLNSETEFPTVGRTDWPDRAPAPSKGAWATSSLNW